MIIKYVGNRLQMEPRPHMNLSQEQLHEHLQGSQAFLPEQQAAAEQQTML